MPAIQALRRSRTEMVVAISWVCKNNWLKFIFIFISIFFLFPRASGGLNG